MQGTNVVASMVVFEDGLAKKSDYRRFSVTNGIDDTAAMAEVVRRRFARHVKDEQDRRDEQGIAAEEGRPRRFAWVLSNRWRRAISFSSAVWAFRSMIPV